MVQRRSARQERLLKEFGANIRRWRKVNGMIGVCVGEAFLHHPVKVAVPLTGVAGAAVGADPDRLPPVRRL